MKIFWCAVVLVFLTGAWVYGEEAAVVPNIASLSPQAGVPGDKIKMAGSGFSKNSNKVTIRNLRREQVVFVDLKSEDTNTLFFVIPKQLGVPDTTFMTDMEKESAKVDITPGFYDVFVNNDDSGQGSNVITLEVLRPATSEPQ